MSAKPPVKRCAIYTRKSSEEGLEQDFNSLHAQRESCEAYVRSQKGEGWRLVETAYDDGGLSGGSMERPALQKLLADIALGKIDVIVVYKVDRLTRSLADFAKMVEVFDANNVSFVAVTQQFNTTSSMGRLTLNILLSFAQFEREVTGERIRDKIAASKAKGMWMGGNVPLGYEVKDRKLLIHNADAAKVEEIFNTYLELGCVRRLKTILDQRGLTSKSGGSFSRGGLYALLNNPIYLGEVRHKGKIYQGQHEAIITRTLWDAVQARLAGNGVKQRQSRKVEASALMGKLYDETGDGLSPSHANKQGRRYRYYVSKTLIHDLAGKRGLDPSGGNQCGWRLPAHEIERLLADTTTALLMQSGELSTAARAEGLEAAKIPMLLEAAALPAINPLDLIERVDLGQHELKITLVLDALVGEPLRLLHHIPLKIRRRGIEMRLVIGNDLTATKADPALMKAIARARSWVEDLTSGRVASLVEIARRERISDRYVGNLLPLAFLAPDIVEAIAAGRQPPELTSERLIKQTEIPLSWNEQRQLLGFAAP